MPHSLPMPRPRRGGALIAAFAFAFAAASTGYGQQAETVSSIGLRTGVATYYGELNDALFPARPELRDLGDNLDYLAWGVDLERYFGNGWGVGLLYTNAEFSASDRAIDWDGELDLGADDFERALNVSTSINDLAAYGLWSANDGRVLSETAALAPFVKLGFGVTRFEPRGDLFLADGRRYRYGDRGAISALDPADGVAVPLASGADGVYETDLRPLRTNGGSEYSRYAYHLLGGLGLNLRLGERFALQLETIARFTTTDNLDDVSGEFQAGGPGLTAYASNPSGRAGLNRGESGSDAYALTTLTARFYLGDRSESFRTPLILVGDLPLEVDDTTAASSRLFRFEPPEPLAADPLDVEPLVFRPQGALSVPQPAVRAIPVAEPRDADVPAIEDFADPGYAPPAFDEAVFGADTSARVAVVADPAARRAAPIVTEYPAAVADDSLAVDEGVASAIDSLGERVASLGTVPYDGLPADELDNLESLTEPADIAVDTVALVSLDSLRAVEATRDRALDSLTNRMAVLREADRRARERADTVALPRDGLAADSLIAADGAPDSAAAARVAAVHGVDSSAVAPVAPPGEPADSTTFVADAVASVRSAAMDSLRRAIDSLSYARVRDARLREDLDRQLRAVRAQRNRTEGGEAEAAPRSRPERVVGRTAGERERSDDARYRARVARMTDEQAELRRQLAALTAEVAALRGPASAPVAPSSTPPASPAAPTSAATTTDPQQAALLAELRALRGEVAALRTPTRTTPVDPGPNAPPTSAPAPEAGSDERLAVVEALRLQGVRRVFFETGRAEVSTAALQELEDVAVVARRFPTYVEVALSGFADRTGSQVANQRLSERRVSAVHGALERLGVSRGQVRVQPMGEDFAADDLAFARRVEVRLRLR